MNRKKNASTVLVYGVLIFITLICLFPIVWMCLISIKSASESITGFNSLMVSNPTMANFKRLFEMIPVGQNAFNSVLPLQSTGFRAGNSFFTLSLPPCWCRRRWEACLCSSS